MKKFIDFMAMGFAAIAVVGLLIYALMHVPVAVLVVLFAMFVMYGIGRWAYFIFDKFLDKFFGDAL